MDTVHINKDTSIEELDISIALFNMLNMAKIVTVGQLQSYTREELEKIFSHYKRSYKIYEIDDVFKQYNLDYKEKNYQIGQRLHMHYWVYPGLE